MKQRPLTQRTHPLYSPLALGVALLLIMGVGVGIYLTGGMAFNPGDLSAVADGSTLAGFTSHADFAQECRQCHTAWQGVTTDRCEACHTNITTQRQTGSGLHGGLELAENCVACHREHKGETYDLTAQAVAEFDHTSLSFVLAQHPIEADITCTNCHTDDTHFPDNPTACIGCHTDDKPDFMAKHRPDFGDNCLACHDGHDTLAQLTPLDHAAYFPLTGAHEIVGCGECHAGISTLPQFTTTPNTCVDCHTEPDSHAGIFGTNCTACHTTTSFQPATIDPTIFDHQRDTNFSLETHQPFACTDCHTTPTFHDFPPNTCQSCHTDRDPAFMSQHVTQFGNTCLACHDGTGRLANFDHSTLFPLDGEHSRLSCESCHAGQEFAGTPNTCVGCHAEPTIHAGLFGTNCASCHTPTAWQPALLRNHSFPLDHGEGGQIQCATCHTQTFNTFTCAACHTPADMQEEHQKEGIDNNLLQNCTTCHPTGTKDEADLYWSTDE